MRLKSSVVHEPIHKWIGFPKVGHQRSRVAGKGFHTLILNVTLWQNPQNSSEISQEANMQVIIPCCLHSRTPLFITHQSFFPFLCFYFLSFSAHPFFHSGEVQGLYPHILKLPQQRPLQKAPKVSATGVGRATQLFKKSKSP